ncbi:MAG: hypothetical protein ACOX30_07080 [Dethiobacteria bacterium]|jgi:predicted transcriptional regulator
MVMSSRQCTFCNYKDRRNLEVRILRKEITQAEVAKIIGVSRQAVFNHMKNHLSKDIILVEKGSDRAEGLNVIDELMSISKETKAILQEARGSKRKDNRLALRAIERLEKQIELQERILGNIKEGNTINLQFNTEYLEIKAIILDILEKYPAAKEEFLERLSAVEADSD